jgi:hypothetical protein
MDFIKKLFSGSSTAPQSHFFSFKVKYNRCGEIIEGRLHPANDLSLGAGERYFVRKAFNPSKQAIEKQAHGGTFVE